MRHQKEVVAVAFSPDARLAATGSADNTARLWEVATGRPVGAPLPHQAWPAVLAFTPDSQALLTGSQETARCWRLPVPVPGDSDRITLAVEVLTGLELDRFGVVNRLGAAAWQQ